MTESTTLTSSGGTVPQPFEIPGARFADAREPVTVHDPIALQRTRAEWIALAALAILSFAVFFVNLMANGYANEFYSAAAQAGSTNWWSMLWGSSDAGNSITVDKPPAALWLMAMSVRLLGLNSFAILLPQALLGVATVMVTYLTVRRYWGWQAGIIAGFVLTITPVAALMFRFNNPDALLVFLMSAASYAVLRSLEYPDERRANRRRTWWIVLAGVCVGLGFLTKQMQVFLVLPGFAAAFLLASPTRMPRRLTDGLLAMAALVISAGWWVLLTVMVPSGSRPFIGGSQNDSFVELTFGYNGFGRLTGSETGSVVPGGGGTAGGNGGVWGSIGITRLFDGVFGGQISWLAPLAAAGLLVGLLMARHARRTDLRRASVIVFGAWLVVTWLTFSFMAGIFHQYYTVALAPALAVLTAVGAAGFWHWRRHASARLFAALVVVVNTLWAAELLSRSSWQPWLRVAVLITGLLGSLLLAGCTVAAMPVWNLAWLRTGLAVKTVKATGVIAGMLSSIALLAGPLAWTGYTMASSYTGSIITAGPSVNSNSSFGGGPGGPGGPVGTGGPGDMGMGGGPGGAAGGGGFLGGGSASSEVAALLSTNADRYTWVAAATGSQGAATYQLATQKPVMPIGGFNGSDPSPTLEQFKRYVAEGRIHYYIASSGMGGGSQIGGSNASFEISRWVESNFTATTVGGVTLYDLTAD